jgi:hypothetical protein
VGSGFERKMVAHVSRRPDVATGACAAIIFDFDLGETLWGGAYVRRIEEKRKLSRSRPDQRKSHAEVADAGRCYRRCTGSRELAIQYEKRGVSLTYNAGVEVRKIVENVGRSKSVVRVVCVGDLREVE